MWLANLFGGRKRPAEIDPDEEPARFAVPAHEATGAHQDLKRRTQPEIPAPKPTSFDPYNSGAFKKKDDAWERVGRR